MLPLAALFVIQESCTKKLKVRVLVTITAHHTKNAGAYDTRLRQAVKVRQIRRLAFELWSRARETRPTVRIPGKLLDGGFPAEIAVARFRTRHLDGTAAEVCEIALAILELHETSMARFL